MRRPRLRWKDSEGECGLDGGSHEVCTTVQGEGYLKMILHGQFAGLRYGKLDIKRQTYGLIVIADLQLS